MKTTLLAVEIMGDRPEMISRLREELKKAVLKLTDRQIAANRPSKDLCFRIVEVGPCNSDKAPWRLTTHET